ncbi:MAG: intermembrane phospholipid transport protein YdbH family protein [Geminicoccaceae bacterium]
MTLLRRIGLFAIAIGALIALLIWSLPMTVSLGLAIAGVDDVTFRSIEIGMRRARLEALAIGEPPRQSVAVIEVDYSLRGLLGGRIDRVRIDGLVVQAAYEDGALDFGGAIGSGLEGDGSSDDGPVNRTPPFITENLVIENGRIDIETPVGPLSLSVNGQMARIDDRLQFSLDVPSADLITDGSETLQAKLQFSGYLPLSDAPRVDQIVASGRLDMQASDIVLPGGEQLVALKDAMDLNFKDGRLTLAGPLDITSEAGSANGKLSAIIEFDEQLRPIAIEDGNAEFQLAEISLDGLGDLDGLDLDRGRVALQLDGARGGLAGFLFLDLDGLTAALGAVEVRGIKMRRVLDLTFNGDIIDVIARTEGDKISVDRVTVGDQIMESGWFTLQWPGREEPWFQFQLDDQRFELDWALEIDPVRLDLAANRFWARIEDLAVTLNGGPEGLRNGAIRIRQGRADLPSANLALAGIESDILLSDRGLAAGRPVPLTIRAVRPLEEPRFFSPLRLDARIDAKTSGLGAVGTLTAASSPKAVLDFAGRHDIEANEGGLDIKLAPLTFSAGQIQPHDLSPMLDGVIEEAEGEIALDGRISWQDGRLASDLAFLIDELGFTIGPARLSRINSVIRFDRLVPPTTSPDQLLSIGLLDVGLPLTDGLVSMQLRPDGQLSVDQLTWRLADGQIRTKPFTFGSDVEDLTLMLTVEQLDLDKLLELTPLDDLTGEGRIDGTLPLTIGEAAAINGGELAAISPGVLRYTPSSAPGVLQAGGESVRLVLQALENFRYEALKITLDGRTDGATAIRLHLKGANPDLYEGHPVEFNLNLEGNLANLVQTNLDNYRIPDRIRERIQGFER